MKGERRATSDNPNKKMKKLDSVKKKKKIGERWERRKGGFVFCIFVPLPGSTKETGKKSLSAASRSMRKLFSAQQQVAAYICRYLLRVFDWRARDALFCPSPVSFLTKTQRIGATCDDAVLFWTSDIWEMESDYDTVWRRPPPKSTFFAPPVARTACDYLLFTRTRFERAAAAAGRRRRRRQIRRHA